MSIFSTDSGREQKERVAKGMVPKIVERMQLPPIEEKPVISIVSPKNPLFGLKAPIGLDKSKILDD